MDSTTSQDRDAPSTGLPVQGRLAASSAKPPQDDTGSLPPSRNARSASVVDEDSRPTDQSGLITLEPPPQQSTLNMAGTIEDPLTIESEWQGGSPQAAQDSELQVAPHHDIQSPTTETLGDNAQSLAQSSLLGLAGLDDTARPADEAEAHHRQTEQADQRSPLPDLESRAGSGVVNLPTSEKIAPRPESSWRPYFLRHRVILTSAILLALMILGLQVMLIYSNHHNGISGADSHYRYLWIYLPSAIFTLASIAWYQVEYDAKMMQPWIEMARKPVTAKRSLLLDYVNPLEPLLLFKAFKAGHVLVAASLGVKYLLQLAIVLSTGILVLQNISTSHQTQVCITSFFGYNGELSELPNSITTLEGTEAYARQVYNFTPNSDSETTFQNRRVVQAFHAVEPPKKDAWNVSAVVNWFISEIQCEDAIPIIQPLGVVGTCNYSLDASPRVYLNQNWANISDSTCFVNGLSLNTPCLDETQRAIQPLETYVLDANWQACKAGSEIGQARIYFSVGGNIRQSVMDTPLVQSRIVQCKPTYLIQNATVTRDQTGRVLDLTPLKPQTDVPPGLISDGDLGSAVVYVYGNAKNTEFFDTNHDVFQASDPIFFAPLTLNRSLLSEFYDNDSGFISAMQDTYTIAAAALMSTHFMIRHGADEPCTRFVEGTTTWLEQRLVVAALPTYIIEGLLGGAVALAIVMLFFIPGSVVSSTPDSLCFAAAIVRRSPDLEALLRNTALLPQKIFRGLLGNYNYRSRMVPAGGFGIELGDVTGVKKVDENRPQAVDKKNWYLPLWFKLTGKILVILVPVSLICALESLLYISRSLPGIANVEDTRSDRYAWLYIPTAILWLSRVLYVGLAFEVLLIEPFYLLATKEVIPGSYEMQALTQNRTRTPAVLRLFSAVMHGRVTVIAACLVGIVAPFLTIFSAGLYTTAEMYNSTSLVMVKPTGFFSASAASSAPRLEDPPLVAGLLAFSDMSFPIGTYETFAFPALDIRSPVTDGQLAFSLPTYRARVRCYEVEDYNLTVVKGFLASDPECLDCGTYSDVDIQFDFSTTDQFTDNWQESWSHTSLNGTQQITVDVGIVGFVQVREEPVSGQPFGEFYIAAMQLEAGRVPKQTTVQVCRTGHEVLDVDVILHYPSLDVLSVNANESSARWFANGTDLWPQYTDVTGAQAVNRSQGLDSLFNTIVYSRWSVPFDDLLTNATLLSRTVEYFTQIEAAQVANRDFRASIEDLQDQGALFIPSAFNTTLLARSERLVQSAIPTRMLDGLLAFLLICTVVIYWKVRYKGVISRQPGSLATTFSLVAGHSLAIPPGMEFWSAKEMKAHEVWKGEVLSLRMWESGTGVSEYRIDGDRRIQVGNGEVVEPAVADGFEQEQESPQANSEHTESPGVVEREHEQEQPQEHFEQTGTPDVIAINDRG
jgi:hypothetical protein